MKKRRLTTSILKAGGYLLGASTMGALGMFTAAATDEQPGKALALAPGDACTTEQSSEATGQVHASELSEEEEVYFVNCGGAF